jgi:hypothetical protein
MEFVASINNRQAKTAAVQRRINTASRRREGNGPVKDKSEN